MEIINAKLRMRRLDPRYKRTKDVKALKVE